MGFFNQFPYTNFHELNLNWVISKIKELAQRVEDVPTEGGLNEVRAKVVAAEDRLNRRIDDLNAADVGAIPASVTKLPNPQSLTFTGAVAGSYDGSSPVTVHIPQGGGAGSAEPLTFSGAVSATYDGSAPVSVDIPEKSATPAVLTFTGGASGTFDGSAPLSINIPTGGGGGMANQPLVFSGAVSASYDGSAQVNVEIPVPPTVPAALPNPQALTFTGAVTGTYDGSSPLNVVIPAGGGEGGNFYAWAGDVQVRTAANQGEGIITVPTDVVLAYGDILIVTYWAYNTGEYSSLGPFSAVVPVGTMGRSREVTLTAIDLGSGASHALSRNVQFKKVTGGFTVTYKSGFRASLGSSGTAAVDDTAIGINDVIILKQPVQP